MVYLSILSISATSPCHKTLSMIINPPLSTSFKDLGPERIKDIRDEGWGQIEFIEVVFREWVKLNQSILDKEYTKQNGVARNDDDLDCFCNNCFIASSKTACLDLPK